MNIAQGSLEELRYYLILARDLCYLPLDASWEEVDEVARMLGAYVEMLPRRRLTDDCGLRLLHPSF